MLLHWDWQLSQAWPLARPCPPLKSRVEGCVQKNRSGTLLPPCWIWWLLSLAYVRARYEIIGAESPGACEERMGWACLCLSLCFHTRSLGGGHLAGTVLFFLLAEQEGCAKSPREPTASYQCGPSNRCPGLGPRQHAVPSAIWLSLLPVQCHPCYHQACRCYRPMQVQSCWPVEPTISAPEIFTLQLLTQPSQPLTAPLVHPTNPPRPKPSLCVPQSTLYSRTFSPIRTTFYPLDSCLICVTPSLPPCTPFPIHAASWHNPVHPPWPMLHLLHTHSLSSRCPTFQLLLPWSSLHSRLLSLTLTLTVADSPWRRLPWLCP